MLLGNKTDLDRVIDYTDGENLAKKNNCLYLECSALKNTGIEDILNEIIKRNWNSCLKEGSFKLSVQP